MAFLDNFFRDIFIFAVVIAGMWGLILWGMKQGNKRDRGVTGEPGTINPLRPGGTVPLGVSERQKAESMHGAAGRVNTACATPTGFYAQALDAWKRGIRSGKAGNVDMGVSGGWYDPYGTKCCDHYCRITNATGVHKLSCIAAGNALTQYLTPPKEIGARTQCQP